MQAGLPTDAWKRTLHHYVSSAEQLFYSMVADGFDASHPVPVDPNGELLNGSHRVACAIALGIKSVPVAPQERFVFAPPWGFDWFMANGMTRAELDRLKSDWDAMRR